MRIIPKTAKVKIEFFRNVSIVDVISEIVIYYFSSCGSTTSIDNSFN